MEPLRNREGVYATLPPLRPRSTFPRRRLPLWGVSTIFATFLLLPPHRGTVLAAYHHRTPAGQILCEIWPCMPDLSDLALQGQILGSG